MSECQKVIKAIINEIGFNNPAGAIKQTTIALEICARNGGSQVPYLPPYQAKSNINMA
jgi:hypothetical protein